MPGMGGGGGQRGGLNRVQHPDRQCTRQQNYVLAVHANNHSSNMIVNQCGAGWGGFEGAGSWAMRNWGKGGGTMGGLGGGGVNTFSSVNTTFCNFSSILCMVMIR